MRTVYLLASSVITSACAWAQCLPQWQNPATTGPTVRAYPGVVFDTSASRVLMYGGGTGSAYRRDLWQWAGTAWSLLDNGLTSGPGARRGHFMSWDADRSKAVVFGGGGVLTSDTWEWSPTGWSQVALAGPTPRGFGAMAFDPALHTSVLFGGWSNGFNYFDDTWTWDGTTWVNASAPGAPHARAFHAMAYDAPRSAIVMYGGLWNDATPSSNYMGDTWEWSNDGWIQLAPVHSPGPRAYHSMTYDPIGQRVLLFGGFEFTAGAFNDIWAWDGADWTRLDTTPIAPLARQAHGATCDTAHDQLLVFGGITGSTFRNDTWTASFPTCGPSCDSIDFNADTLFPDTLDIDDFLSVFSGGTCSNDPNCGDIDFNNDALFPDTLDIDALLSVFSGGPCF